MVRSEYLLVYLFIIATGSFPVRGFAQATDSWSVAVPLAEFKTATANPGAKVFLDDDVVFGELPALLKGRSYIVGSKIHGANAAPVTPGKIYVARPANQQPVLSEQDGFTLTTKGLHLFKNNDARFDLYSKVIEYKNFRLPSLSIPARSILFFSEDPLPSALVPAKVLGEAAPEYQLSARQWQGCPSIEKTGKRLWAAWFSGGDREPAPGNYGIVGFSDDDGKSWDDPAIVIVHPDTSVRVMDPQLWKDPMGKLWIFWVQNTGTRGFDGRWGTWSVCINDPEAAVLSWTAPKKICGGLTRNKPVVLSSGIWLLPSYNWAPDYRSAVYASADQGRTWKLQGGPVNPGNQNFYEHMLVELKDGRVWMLQRDIQESYSSDAGKTWTALATLPDITAANARLYIGRLRSGRLLLIYNDDQEKRRRNLTAFLSDDEGKTWPYKLLLDERMNVSYPDAVEDEQGEIYITYDRGRGTEKEILLLKLREQDIIKQEWDASGMRMMISKPPL